MNSRGTRFRQWLPTCKGVLVVMLAGILGFYFGSRF